MDNNYNYLGGYDYGYNEDNALIPKSQGVDKEEVNKAINNLVGNAPEEFDTLEELAQAVQELGGAELTEIRQELENKADKSELENLATKDEVQQVVSDVQKLIQDAPEDYDTLKEIIDLIETKGDATEILAELSTKVNSNDFNAHVLENTEAFAAINETMATKLDSNALQGYVQDANYVHTDNNYTTEEKTKLEGLSNYDDSELAERVNVLENANYVEDANYVHTDNNYTTEEKTKLEGLSNYDDSELAERVNVLENANYVEDANYVHTDNNYTTEEKTKLEGVEDGANVNVNADWNATEGDAQILNKPAFAAVATSGDYNDLDNKPSAYDDTELKDRITALENAPSTVDTRVSGVDVVIDEDEGKLLVIASTDGTNESEVSVKTTKIFDYSQYYTKEETNATFIDNNEANTLINAAVAPKASTADLMSAVHELVVRLDKLEAQNAYLVENNTTRGETINNMSDADALSAEITVCTPDAVNALKTNKEFKSVSLIGAEVGNDDVIYTTAVDNVVVNGVTVSGTKGSNNGKIHFATNEINISNVNIEPGCTVYNVFEGSQDKDAGHSIDTFIATNVVVNDTDLKHNVFNIYQFNNDAEVLIKDSSFNLDVANSNILRVSNITNAQNVTITFENVDWTYENKAYTDADKVWAGLMIYQPYGSDAAFSGDTRNMRTWTVRIKNCRYNGETITENLVGDIKQAVYQYNLNNSGTCEAPTAIGLDNIIVE